MRNLIYNFCFWLHPGKPLKFCRELLFESNQKSCRHALRDWSHFVLFFPWAVFIWLRLLWWCHKCYLRFQAVVDNKMHLKCIRRHSGTLLGFGKTKWMGFLNEEQHVYTVILYWIHYTQFSKRRLIFDSRRRFWGSDVVWQIVKGQPLREHGIGHYAFMLCSRLSQTSLWSKCQHVMELREPVNLPRAPYLGGRWEPPLWPQPCSLHTQCSSPSPAVWQGLRSI